MCLSRIEFILDLPPGGVGCHCNEEISMAKITTNCHAVLEELKHVVCTTNVSGWENKALAKIIKVMISCIECIHNTFVDISTQSRLIVAQPIELVLLCHSPSIYCIHMMQLAAVKYDIWLALSWKKLISVELCACHSQLLFPCQSVTIFNVIFQCISIWVIKDIITVIAQTKETFTFHKPPMPTKFT